MFEQIQQFVANEADAAVRKIFPKVSPSDEADIQEIVKRVEAILWRDVAGGLLSKLAAKYPKAQLLLQDITQAAQKVAAVAVAPAAQ